MFQRQRVDMLLGELLRKFPLPSIADTPVNSTLTAPTLPVPTAPTTNTNQTSTASDAQTTNPQAVTLSTTANANGTQPNNGNVDSRPSKLPRLA